MADQLGDYTIIVSHFQDVQLLVLVRTRSRLCPLQLDYGRYKVRNAIKDPGCHVRSQYVTSS